MTDSSTAQEPWEQPGWLSPEEFRESEGVEDWRLLGDAVYGFFRTDSLASSARLVQAIAELPDNDEDDQPELDIRREGVTVRLTTVSEGLFFCGYSPKSVAVARQISAAARELGVSGRPDARAAHPGFDRRARDPGGDALLARGPRLRVPS